MDDLEKQLASVMNNPAMMQQIMAMAQSFSQPPAEEAPPQDTASNPLPDIDFSMIQKLSGLAQKSSVDQKQQALLQALRPYINSHRVQKLERAMRAAKMAGFATSLIGR